MAKIVVMEDEPDIAMLVETTLTFGGHEVEMAPNGHTGINLIRQHQPEMVLCDVQMPDISGYDVLKIVKNDQELCSVPIFLFSANNRPEDIKRGQELGAAGFMCKPFDPQDLLQKVNEELDNL